MRTDPEKATDAHPRITGSGRSETDPGRFFQPLMGVLITGIYVFLLAPIFVVVVTSFSPDTSNTYEISRASLHWYRQFIANDSFVSAFSFSVVLALIASFGATLIGLITAYGLVRALGRRRGLGQSLVMLPMMVPHILISLSLLLLLTRLPLPEMAALVIGHILICLPFTIAGITASLDGVDKTIEEAAYTLGASRMRILREITIPLVGPGVLSASIFAFIISFGDVYVSLFISAPGVTTLPVEIFSYVQWESSPIVAAITTVQIVMIVIFGLIIEKLIGVRSIILK